MLHLSDLRSRAFFDAPQSKCLAAAPQPNSNSAAVSRLECSELLATPPRKMLCVTLLNSTRKSIPMMPVP